MTHSGVRQRKFDDACTVPTPCLLLPDGAQCKWYKNPDRSSPLAYSSRSERFRYRMSTMEEHTKAQKTVHTSSCSFLVSLDLA